MRFDVLTLFPGLFASFLTESLLGKAIEAGRIAVALHDFREYAEGRHRQVDDRPYGGGAGMVIAAPPVVACVESLLGPTGHDGADNGPGRPATTELILFTPSGTRLDQPLVETLASRERIVMICGRYEGFDQRVIDILRPREVSIGDYVLNGGEVAAMVVIEAVVRLIEGVLGDPASHVHDSFSSGNRLLEYPQYTRPRTYRGHDVPEILFSGHHAEIEAWRRAESLTRTRARRPDLLDDPSS